MTPDDEDDDGLYSVVVNHEEQYSIWLAARPLPRGWILAGKTGRKKDCLAYIDNAWTDMRPLSVRRAIHERPESRASAPEGVACELSSADSPNAGPTLVERLSTGVHQVRLESGATMTDFRACVERGFVRLRFTHEQGATLLGIQPEQVAASVYVVNSANATGSVHLEGTLTLDGKMVRCIVDLGAVTLCGEGRLIPVVEDPQ